MKYPEFYDRVVPIVMRDPLADTLGAFAEGIIEYGYLDVAKLAGHSCPTVAGAFLMARHGLATLYGSALPVRGEIEVAMQQNRDEGVCGVIANVFSLITGATEDSGFHGLGGQYDRRRLLSFNSRIPTMVRFSDRLGGGSVQVQYNPAIVPADPEIGFYLSKVLSGRGSAEEKSHFHQLWQGRVESILCDFADDPRLISVERL